MFNNLIFKKMKQEKETVKDFQQQKFEQHVEAEKRCPVCGSEDYAGGSLGGRCMECGYTVGFHGSSDFKNISD